MVVLYNFAKLKFKDTLNVELIFLKERYMKRRISIGLAILLSIALITACSGPEEKKLKFFNKGKELYEKGQYTEAKLEFKNAIQIDNKYAEAYYMLGMVEMRSGNPQGAYGSFNKAVELDPNHLQAQIELGRLFLGARMTDKAQEKIDLILKADPKNEEGLLLQGALFLSKQDYSRSRLVLDGLIARGVTKPDLYMLLAALGQASGDAKAEEAALLKGIEINPKFAGLYLALADYHVRHKRLEEAAADMKKVIEIDPGNVRYRTMLANILLGRGQDGGGRRGAQGYNGI